MSPTIGLRLQTQTVHTKAGVKLRMAWLNMVTQCSVPQPGGHNSEIQAADGRSYAGDRPLEEFGGLGPLGQ